MFKANKAVGVVRHGKAIQVIVGLDVAQVLEKMQDLSSGPISTDASEQPTVKELTPIQQNATLVMDSLGTNQNIENVEDVAGELLVTVVDPAEVDNEQIFKDLSLGIEKVVLDGKKVTISMPNHEKYVQAILSLI
jgi:PTS system arbutin-like IIC component